MRRLLLGLTIVALSMPAMMAQDEFDDIYYNPKKDTAKESKKESKKKKKESNYIADFSSMDVDDYNRRGFYYESPVDTIGNQAENAEDFVYTQQIQKFYNPTIVVDNADILGDVLEDSYGNIDIVIENGVPMFSSIYTGLYGWVPSYYNWYYSPSWTWNYAWGPSWSWTWGSSWTWGPSWSWGWSPSWSWGWSPSWSWGWGPSWGGGHGPRPGGYHAYHRPGASAPVMSGGGWAHNTRPGGNMGHGASRPGIGGSRPANGVRPSGAATSRPGSNLGRYGNHRSNTEVTGASSNRNGNFGTGTYNRRQRNTGASNSTVGRISNTVIGNSGYTQSTNPGKRGSINKNSTESKKSYNTNNSRASRSYNSNTSRSYNNNSNRSYNSGSSRSYNSGSSYRSGGSGYSSGHRSGGSYSGGRSGGASRGGGSHGGRR